jgi:hypothetical protein|tara:strand:+ start:169 stop:522 length:354 start_codon:yes stop_codon:yes gene_type:complete
MDIETKNTVKDNANQKLYWQSKQEQARDGEFKADQRILETLLLEYKDILPIVGKYIVITIDEYTIQIDNVRDTYVISNLTEKVEPPTPVTLASAIAEGAPSWAIAAATVLEPKQEEE